jgi:GTP pyrophosphokinase
MSENVLDTVHATVQGADPSSLERARRLIASKFSEDERARESMNRGAAAAELLSKLAMDDETLAAALLFPALDEGALDGAAIEKSAGADIARLTRGALRIASLKDLRKTATATLQANRLRQMLLTIAEDPRVVVVSLAQQLCALRAVRNAPERARRALGQETLEVFAPLANRLGVWQLKQELEDLAFRYLEPDTYKRIAAGLDQRRTDRGRYIAQVVARLREELHRAGISAEISGRPKHVYSVWNKMRQKGVDLSKVFDVLGFRILVNDVSDCYAALSVVHGLWEPILDAFDDYIAKPKPNGYQSLHTAVIGPKGVTMEVQIRNFTMHRHADLGVAAHWQYKEGLQSRIAWSRGFLESAAESTPHELDLIDRFKQAAFHDRIYVLTPQGHIIDLPANATPLDFAYAIHTEVGHRCRGAKVDGVMVPLTKTLASGQQVEILTSREGHPSRDWLNANLGYLKTSSARAKVRRWLKQQDHEAHIAQGRSLLEREHRRLGVSEINIAELTKRFKMRRPEDLLAALGCGDISTVRIGHALGAQLPPQAPSTAPLPATPSRRSLLVHGTSNVLTKVAGCCKPVPGEPIGGYVTAQGGGISIHRRDCPNLKLLTSLRPHKAVEVAWEAD